MTFVGSYVPMVTLFSSIFCPHKLPIAGNIGTKYLQKVSYGWEIHRCPLGKLFVPDRCMCLPAHLTGKNNRHLYILRRKDNLKSKYSYPKSGKNILLFTGRSSNMNVYQKYPIPSGRSYENPYISKTYNAPGLITSPTSGVRKQFIHRNRPNDLYAYNTYQGINKLGSKSPNIKANTKPVFIIMKYPPKKPDIHINIENNDHSPSGSIQRHLILRNKNIQKHSKNVENFKALNFPLQSENSHTFNTGKDMTNIRHGSFHPNGKNDQVIFQTQDSSHRNYLLTENNIGGNHHLQTNPGNGRGISLQLDTPQNTDLRNINNVDFGRPLTELQPPLGDNSVNSRDRTSQALENIKSRGTLGIQYTNPFREFPVIQRFNNIDNVDVPQRHPGDNSKISSTNYFGVSNFGNIPLQQQGNSIPLRIDTHPNSKNKLSFANDLGVNNIGNIPLQQQDNSIPLRMDTGLDNAHPNSKNKLSFANDLGVNNIGNIPLQQQDNSIPLRMDTGLDNAHSNSRNKLSFANDLGVNNIGNIPIQQQDNSIPLRMDTGLDNAHSNSKDKLSFANHLGLNNIGNNAIHQQENSIPFGMATGLDGVHQKTIALQNDLMVNNIGNVAIQQQKNNIPFRMETGHDGSHPNSKSKISFANDVEVNDISNIAIQQQDENIPFGIGTSLDGIHPNKIPLTNDVGVNDIGNIAIKQQDNSISFGMDTGFDGSNLNSKNKISFTNDLGVNNVGDIATQQQDNAIPFRMETDLDGSHRNSKIKTFANDLGVIKIHKIVLKQKDNNIPFGMETKLDRSKQKTDIPSQKSPITSENNVNINNDTGYNLLPYDSHWDQSILKQGSVNNFNKTSFITKTFFENPLKKSPNSIGKILTPHSFTDSTDNVFLTDPGMSHFDTTAEVGQSNVDLNGNSVSVSDTGVLSFSNNVHVPSLVNNISDTTIKYTVPSNTASKAEPVENSLHSIGKETSGLTLPFDSNIPSDLLPLTPFSPVIVQTSANTKTGGQQSLDRVPISSGATGGKSQGSLNFGSVTGIIKTQPNVRHETPIANDRIVTLKEVGNELNNLSQTLSPINMDTAIQQLDKEASIIESGIPVLNPNKHMTALSHRDRNTFENVMGDQRKPTVGSGKNPSNDSFGPLGQSEKPLNFPGQTREGILLVKSISGESKNGINPSNKDTSDANTHNAVNYIPEQSEIINDSSVDVPKKTAVIKEHGFVGRESVGEVLVDKIKTPYADRNGIFNIDGFSVPAGNSRDQNLDSVNEQQKFGGSTDLLIIPTADIQNSGQSPDIISQVKAFVKSKMLAAFKNIDQENDVEQSSTMAQPDVVNIDLLSGQGRFVTPTGAELPLMSEHSVVGGVLESTELSPEICMGCTMDGGLGYTNHPERCDQFVVCYPEVNGVFRPIAQDCPYGQFWSKQDVTCRPSKNVRCNMDMCNSLETGYMYSHRSSCVSYWECQGGFSVARCCAPGQAFTSAGCQPSKTCQDVCPDDGVFVWDVGCNKRSIPNTVSAFEKYSLPGGWRNSTCGEGAIFKREICDCVPVHKDTSTYNFDEQCRPEVFLPFDSDFRDYSGSNTFVRVNNVTLTNGAACFNGSSVLALPKFANMDLGSTIYVKLRYKQGDLSLGTEALLYNGDCDEQFSMVIGTKPSGNAFTIRTTTQEVQTIWVPSSVPANDWREVVMTVNGDRMEGSTDTYTKSTIISGGVARSTCGIKLGWGKGFPNFVGCIDEMSLYRCNPGLVSGFTAQKT